MKLAPQWRSVPLALLALTAATPTRQAHAQERGAGLSLVEAVAHALEHYPGMSAARYAADGAASAAAGASAARWPSLLLSTSAFRYQEPMLVTPIHGFTPGLSPPFDENLLQGAASLRYTVFDGLGRGALIDASRAESEAASFEVTGTAQALAARVSAIYLGVLGSAAVLDAQDRRLTALDAERVRIGQLLEVGRAADVDLMRVEAARAAAQAERVSLAAALEVGERELSRLTGVPVDRTRAPRLAAVRLDRAPLEAREALLEEALRRNPVVLRSQSRSAAAQARSAAARSERWPQVDLAANYLGWASGQDDPIAEWNVGVAVSWPLFTGGRVGHQIQRSQAEAGAAAERLRLMETEVAEELDRTLSAVGEAEARVASLITAVTRSAEVARIEQLRLDAGSGVQRDYLDAEAVLFGNRAALVQAQYAEILARLQLARVTGQLDLGWLTTNFGDTP